jgi:hypothetical protein
MRTPGAMQTVGHDRPHDIDSIVPALAQNARAGHPLRRNGKKKTWKSWATRLEQANPQGVLLIAWSGGAQPINQGAGSGVLHTSGISGIFYGSPGSAAGYAPQLNGIPTFTYWGTGPVNSVVYAANGLNPNGYGSNQYSPLPPGGSSTVPGCDHNFQCLFDSGVFASIVSNCNTSLIVPYRNDNPEGERFSAHTQHAEGEINSTEVESWVPVPHILGDTLADVISVE